MVPFFSRSHSLALKSSNDNLFCSKCWSFHSNYDAFTQTPFFELKRLPFDDFLMATSLQENKSERKKEPAIPRLKFLISNFNCPKVASIILNLNCPKISWHQHKPWSTKVAGRHKKNSCVFNKIFIITLSIVPNKNFRVLRPYGYFFNLLQLFYIKTFAKFSTPYVFFPALPLFPSLE